MDPIPTNCTICNSSLIKRHSDNRMYLTCLRDYHKTAFIYNVNISCMEVAISIIIDNEEYFEIEINYCVTITTVYVKTYNILKSFKVNSVYKIPSNKVEIINLINRLERLQIIS